jgi:hypothetical protein
MKSTDFAYAAGYIDGDGSFMLQYPWGSSLTVVSTNKEPITWFVENFHGNLRCYNRNDGVRKKSYYFRFSEKGIESIPNIFPYLVEKRNECLCFQHFRESKGEIEKQPFIEEMKKFKYEFGLIHDSPKEELNSIKMTISPTEEDFAYLAGYIDAECSLDIGRCLNTKTCKTPQYHPQLQCNNTKSPFFFWASARFGGQFHFRKYPNGRNQLIWRISHKQFDPILYKIFPFLKSKKSICEKIIEFRKLTLGKGRVSQRHPNFSEWYSSIASQREQIYNEVRHLNKIV